MLQVAFLTSSALHFVIWPAIGIATGIYAFFRGFRLVRRKRLILNTPASKIRSASMGLVEISGIAIGPHLVLSALKQTECFYYRSVAWELKQRGKQREWVKLAEETLHVPFYLDDSTDRLLIDPRGAVTDLHCELHEEYDGGALIHAGDVPRSITEFLVRHGVSEKGKIKLEEYCIKPESFLFALGTLSQNPGIDVSVAPPWAVRMGEPPAEPSAPEEAVPEDGSQKVIRLSVTPAAVSATEMTQQQKIAAALVKAGISTGPWSPPVANTTQTQTGASHAATAVAEKRASADTIGYDLHPPVVLMKGSNDATFFISWRSQRDMVNSSNWKSALMIWGGLGLAIACLYEVIVHFR